MTNTIARLRRQLARRILLSSTLVGFAPVAAKAQTSYTWNNSAGGSWTDPNSWSPNGIPGNNSLDNAAIALANATGYIVNYSSTETINNLTINSVQANLALNSGPLTVNGALTLTNGILTVAGSTLTSNGTFTTASGTAFNLSSGIWQGTASAAIGGSFTWSSGAIQGAGTTTVTGPANLTFTTKSLGGNATLILAGSSTWDAGAISVDGNSTFRVASGGTLTNTGGTSFQASPTVGGLVDLQGNFTKTSAGTTTFGSGLNYNLARVVDVQAGTLTVNGNSIITGTVQADGAGLVQFAQNNQTVPLGNTATFGGSGGIVAVTGGTLIVNGSLTTLPSVNFQVAGGTLQGAGNVSSGNFTWSSGIIQGSGTTTVTGPANLTFTTKSLGGNATLVLAGSSTWDAGAISVDGNSTFRVASGGTLTNTGGTSFQASPTVGGLVDLQGNFTKTSAGTTTFGSGLNYNLARVVDVQAGTLTVNGNSIITGTVQADGAGLVQFAQNNQTVPLGNTATFGGSGGIVAVTGGTLIVNGSLTTLPSVNFQVAGGTLQGAGNVSSGNFTWSSGTIQGSGTTTVTGPANLTFTTKSLGGNATLVLAGSSTWDAGAISVDGNSTFRVASGGTLTNTGGTSFQASPTVGGLVDLQGNFTKTSAGTTTFGSGLNYNLARVVDVQAGTLTVNGNSIITGTVQADGAGLVQFAQNNQTVPLGNTATFGGSGGIVAVTGGTLIVNGSLTTLPSVNFQMAGGTLQGTGNVSAGNFTWSSGTIQGSGTTTVTGPANLTFTTKSLGGNATLVLAGSSTWDTGSISVDGNTIFRVASGGTLINTGNTTLQASPTVGGSIDIEGTFRKTSTGATNFQAGLIYTIPGTLDLEGGTLTNNGNTTYSGNVTATANATLAIGGGNQTFTSVSNATLAGTLSISSSVFINAPLAAGNFALSGGTTTANAVITTSNFGLSGGTLQGTGNVNAGNFTWSSGTIQGSGTTTVTGISNLTSSTKLLGGNATLVLAGTGTWDAGAIETDGNTVFRVASGGTLVATGNNTTLLASPTNGGLIDIEGTFRKTSTGATNFQAGLIYTIPGTLDLEGGTLTVNGNTTYSGNVTATANATLAIGGGNQTFTSGSNATLAGTLAVAGGSVFITAPLTAGNFALSGGTTTANAVITTSNFGLSGGTLQGTGNVNAGNFTWSSGTIQGSGTTTVTGISNLTSSTKLLGGNATLVLAGTGTWDAGAIETDGNTVFRVASGGTLVATGNNTTLLASPTNGGLIDIEGTFRKTSTGATNFQAGLIYTIPGTLDLEGGTLTINGNTTYSGNVTATANATLAIGGGNQTFTSGSNATLAGTLSVGSGSVFITAPLTAGNFALSGGTTTANAVITTSNFGLSGGILQGTSNVNAGNFTWSAGTIQGSGTTTVTGFSNLTSSTKLLGGNATLILAGNGTWDAGAIETDGNTVFRVASGVTLVVTGNNTTLLASPTNGGSIDIEGTFRKTSTGATTFGAGLIYTIPGTLDLQGGTLTVSGNTTYSGNVTATANATLAIGGGNQTFTSGSNATLAGTLAVAGGSVFITAPLTAGNFALSGGTTTANAVITTSNFSLSGGILQGTGNVTATSFNWTAGTIQGSGTTTVTGTANLAASVMTLSGNATLILAGTSTWSSGSIFTDANTVFRVPVGATLLNTGNTFFSTNATPGGLFDIVGTFQKTSTGTTTFNSGPVYSVSGTVDVEGGILSITSAANLTSFANGTGLANGTLTAGTWLVGNATLDLGTRTIQTIGVNASVTLSNATSSFVALANVTQINGVLQIINGNSFTPESANSSVGGVGVAGVLQVGAGSTLNKPSSFGGGALVTVQSGGLLTGAGNVNGRLAALTGATIRPGDNGVAGPLNASALTFGNASTLNVVGGTTNSVLFLTGSGSPLAAATGPEKLAISLTNDGTLNLNGTTPYKWSVIHLLTGTMGSITTSNFLTPTATNFSFVSTPTVSLDASNVFVSFTPLPAAVPEPVWIFGLASGALVMSRVRRRRREAKPIAV